MKKNTYTKCIKFGHFLNEFIIIYVFIQTYMYNGAWAVSAAT